MTPTPEKKVKYLIVDTTAFIQNAPVHDVSEHIITCEEVVDEIINKRQLRRLVALPYDLEVKRVYQENIELVTNFTKKTGDYPSLSATDIKVMALTYQLEKEYIGTEHLRSEPVMQRIVSFTTKSKAPEVNTDVSGFYLPGQKKESSNEANNKTNGSSNNKTNESEGDQACKSNCETELKNHESAEQSEVGEKTESEQKDDNADNILDTEDILSPCNADAEYEDEEDNSNSDDDDDVGWITPSNIATAKKQVNSELMEEKAVTVACMTTDFAMQNVLKQMNLNIAALDGRMIKQLRTYILRCYACFKTTSIMTKQFCPNCGNNTLKRVAVSLDTNGKQQIHINARRPLTARGKKFSLPKIRGGKHSKNPILVADQPMPQQRPSRLARTKTDVMDDAYVAGYSPFVMRDITSKSAQLKIRPDAEIKHWMRKNHNEVVHHRSK